MPLQGGPIVTGVVGAEVFDPADSPDSNIRFSAETGANGRPRVRLIDYRNAVSGGGQIVGERARGTRREPTVVVNDAWLLTIAGSGWNGSAFMTGGRLQLKAAESWSEGITGTKMILQLTAIGGSAQADVLEFFSTDLRPSTNNAVDLGTAALAFKNLYLAGSITIGGKAVTEGAADSGGAGFKLLRVAN